MAERVGVNGSGAFFVKKCDSPKANGDASQFGKKTHPEFFRVDSMLEKGNAAYFFNFPSRGNGSKEVLWLAYTIMRRRPIRAEGDWVISSSLQIRKSQPLPEMAVADSG